MKKIFILIVLSGSFFFGNSLLSNQNSTKKSNRNGAEVKEQVFHSQKLNYTIIKNHSKNKTSSLTKRNNIGDTLGWTDYDYGCNNVMRRRLALSGNGLHFVYDNGGFEYNFYSKNLGFLGGQEITGWVKEVANGIGNKAYFASHIYIPNSDNETWFSKDSCEGCFNFTHSNIGSKSISSIARSGNNIYIGGTETIYVSTDDGETFTESASFPELLVGQFFGSSEISLSTLSDDPSTIAFAFIEEEDYNSSIFSGALSWGKSTDAGTTWSTNIIVNEEDISADAIHYLVENFGQLSNILSNDCRFHVVFNGYGVQMSDTNPDSAVQFIYPLMYWNDVEQQLMELSSPEISRDTSLSWGNRPGNGLGNAYPSIAASDDGVLAVIWQKPEIANDEFVMLTNSDHESAYATDIYCSVSPNNGLSWSAPFKVAGTESESDVFPVIAKSIEITNDGKYIIHFMYMWDTEIGVSLFDGGGSQTESAWIYKNFDISDQLITVGINDNDKPMKINDYSLSQNYPNPFNPSTRIEFRIQQSEFISLKVYDVLGNQITTLVNERKSAGTYQVEFDASYITSGIYFYELIAGGFRQTNKMLFLK
jgi:hypothetical protein